MSLDRHPASQSSWTSQASTASTASPASPASTANPACPFRPASQAQPASQVSQLSQPAGQPDQAAQTAQLGEPSKPSQPSQPIQPAKPATLVSMLSQRNVAPNTTSLPWASGEDCEGPCGGRASNPKPNQTASNRRKCRIDRREKLETTALRIGCGQWGWEHKIRRNAQRTEPQTQTEPQE